MEERLESRVYIFPMQMVIKGRKVEATEKGIINYIQIYYKKMRTLRIASKSSHLFTVNLT